MSFPFRELGLSHVSALLGSLDVIGFLDVRFLGHLVLLLGCCDLGVQLGNARATRGCQSFCFSQTCLGCFGLLCGGSSLCCLCICAALRCIYVGCSICGSCLAGCDLAAAAVGCCDCCCLVRFKLLDLCAELRMPF